MANIAWFQKMLTMFDVITETSTNGINATVSHRMGTLAEINAANDRGEGEIAFPTNLDVTAVFLGNTINLIPFDKYLYDGVFGHVPFNTNAAPTGFHLNVSGAFADRVYKTNGAVYLGTSNYQPLYPVGLNHTFYYKGAMKMGVDFSGSNISTPDGTTWIFTAKVIEQNDTEHLWNATSAVTVVQSGTGVGALDIIDFGLLDDDTSNLNPERMVIYGEHDGGSTFGLDDFTVNISFVNKSDLLPVAFVSADTTFF